MVGTSPYFERMNDLHLTKWSYCRCTVVRVVASLLSRYAAVGRVLLMVRNDLGWVIGSSGTSIEKT